MKKNPSFEDALERLEQIARLLEKGELSLEESLKLYEEGSRLAALCSKTLGDAKQRVEELSGMHSQSEANDAQ